MPIRYAFENQFFRYLQQLDRKWYVRPLNLGSSYNGTGGPPGGFIGYLPQDRVSYDDIEVASSGIPASGISLVDNMNHIRYRLNSLETGGISGGITFQEDDVTVASGVTIANFEGGVTVTDNGGNKVTIDIAGSLTDEKTKVSANDTTANYLLPKLTAGADISVTELNNGGDETVEIAYTGITTDEFAKISANDLTTGYLDGKIIAGTYVTLVQVNDGGDEQLQINCTASGISGPDELIKISSNDTTAEYLETKITSGDGITINVLYEGINEQLDINSDGMVAISDNDTTIGYLDGKLVAGSGISLTELNDGVDETLRIDCTVSGITGSGIETYTDTYANIPTGNAGDLFFPDDGYTMERKDNSTWNAWGPIFPITKMPAISSFAWINQDGATATETKGGIYMYHGVDVDNEVYLLKKAIGQTTNYRITVGLVPNLIESYNRCGIAIRDSASGKIMGCNLMTVDNHVNACCHRWDSATSWDGDVGNMPLPSTPLFLQLEVKSDGGDDWRKYRYSYDGQNFRTYYTELHDYFCLADEYGIFITDEDDVWDVGCLFLSLKLEIW